MKTNGIKITKAQHEKFHEIYDQDIYIFTLWYIFGIFPWVSKTISLRTTGISFSNGVYIDCVHIFLGGTILCCLLIQTLTAIPRVETSCFAEIKTGKANVFDAGRVQKWALFLLCSSIHLAGFMSSLSMLSNQVSCCAPLINSSMLMLPADQQDIKDHHVEVRLRSFQKTYALSCWAFVLLFWNLEP